MKRRDFLKYFGVGAVGTGIGLLTGRMNKPPGAKLIPYLVPPEDIIPGEATWYASLCTQCSSGCGVLVKIMEGRAKKVEGNPSHPVNRGRLCIRGHSSLQALYNPDRIKSPMRLNGARGSGKYSPISWGEAVDLVASRIRELMDAGDAKGVYLLTSTLRGTLGKLAESFLSAAGSDRFIQYELFGNTSLRFANQATMGLGALPYYDVENTRYLLSFGADFSSTWLSPVNLSRGYGEMRQGSATRGKLVHVEPRMSLTAANADEWVPAKPGTEGILALAMAHEIVAEGHYDGPEQAGWEALLSAFSPRKAASITGIEHDRIRHMAEEFATTRPSLAIGGDAISGYNDGVACHVAVNVLNHVAGNLGLDGGVVPNPEGILTGGPGSEDGLTKLLAAARAGGVKALMLYNTNPLFTTPASARAADAFDNIPFIASFSSFMDETTAHADVILPSHTSLEDWGDDVTDPAPGYEVSTLMQPVVSPVFDTRGLGDIFISIGGKIGGPVAAKMPGGTFADHLKAAWKDRYSRSKAMSASAPDFQKFWLKALAEGGWWNESARSPRSRVRITVRNAQKVMPRSPSVYTGDSSKYPLYLLLYPQAGFYDGRGANIPWLQELPDPVTSVVWDSWVEINPDTARRFSIAEGDMVTVESPWGKVSAPAVLYPGIRPDTVAMPIGQGHKHYGRYAKDRGANPFDILPYRTDSDSGALAFNSTRVNILRAGKGELVKMDAHQKELGRGIVQTVTPEEYKRMKKEV